MPLDAPVTIATFPESFFIRASPFRSVESDGSGWKRILQPGSEALILLLANRWRPPGLNHLNTDIRRMALASRAAPRCGHLRKTARRERTRRLESDCQVFWKAGRYSLSRHAKASA